VIPYDAIRAAYLAKEAKGAKVVGRPPPPRPVANRVDDDLGRVLEDAAARARNVLVAVRALPLEGETDAPVDPPPPPQPEPGKPPPGPPPCRRVPGEERGYDRSSGLIIGEEGLVLAPLRITGWPQATRPVQVDLADGRSFRATVLGSDERLRLVLLWIDVKGLVPLERAPAEGFRAGALAIALGYPHMRPKDTPQLTFGILSRTGALTQIHHAFAALATDAGVSESNRGGPLVDVDGRLLGILVDVNDADLQGYHTRARGAYAGNAGLGFAVPWTVLDGILPRLRAGDVLKAGVLGIELSGTPGGGVEVTNVAEKNAQGQPTGAKEGGMLRGDVIIAVDGNPVRTQRDLRAALSARSAGDKVTIRVRREGAELDLSITLRDA
jgi:S1-C subfamily serine protease